jgi:hypothetical protein
MLIHKTYVYVMIQFVVWSLLWETGVGLLCGPICICNNWLRGHVCISHGCVENNVPVIVFIGFLFIC